jgi:hypothetical protein
MSGTRDQVVDAVPPELRAVANGEIDADARDSEDAPEREPPLVALLARAAQAPSSQTVSVGAAFLSALSEISGEPEDAPLAEPSLHSVSVGDALDAPDTLNTQQSTANRARAALAPRHARLTPIRRAYLIAAMVGAILVLAFVGIYVASRNASPKKLEVLGASARPPVPATFGPGPTFELTHVGSGGVFLAVVRPHATVRVSIDGDVVGTWFWCFESSFGIPLAEHFCAGASNSEPGQGELVSQGVIRIDPSWPADAMYFVQMYCERSCTWHAQVVPP